MSSNEWDPAAKSMVNISIKEVENGWSVLLDNKLYVYTDCWTMGYELREKLEKIYEKPRQESMFNGNGIDASVGSSRGVYS